jgi:hypothetical protein
MAICPATGSTNYRFLNIMNTDINSSGHGKYTVGVTDNGSTIDITVDFDSGTRTVEINTSTFAVAIS